MCNIRSLLEKFKNNKRKKQPLDVLYLSSLKIYVEVSQDNKRRYGDIIKGSSKRMQDMNRI
jgi:hypothetical protein